MYLTKITARNLKGGDFSYALERGLVITGDNFAGKTRIADAIRLLLIGYLPELGKTNAATFGLASGSVMEVEGEFDTGEKIARRWSAKGDSVKGEILAFPIALQTCELLTVMLNAEEYFALSPRDRVNYVFANCPIAGTEVGALNPRIAKAAPEYDFNAVVAKIDPAQSVQEYIEAAILAVTDDWKRSKETAKRMEETVRGLTALRSNDETTRPLAAIEDEQATVARTLTEIQERKSLHSGDYAAMVAARSRREQIAREMTYTEKERVALLAAKEKLRLAREKTDTIVASSELRKTLAVLQESRNEARHNVSKLDNELTQATREHQKVEGEISSLDHKSECPYCGATGEGWKAIKAAEYASYAHTLDEQITAIRAFAVAANEKFQAISLAVKTNEEELTVKENLESLERILLAEIGRLEPALARAKALEEERDRLPSEDPLLETQVQLIQTEFNIQQQKTATLDREAKNAIGRAHDLKRLADAEKERDGAKQEQELAAAAGKELRVIQGELVEAAFKPLLATANAIFGNVLPSPLAYKDGEIGTHRNGLFIGHRTMSGTEKALTYAAIQTALAAKSPVRLLIMDEMGRFTKHNAKLCATWISAAMKSGKIDQAILIDPERPELYQTLAVDKDFPFQIIEIR